MEPYDCKRRRCWFLPVCRDLKQRRWHSPLGVDVPLKVFSPRYAKVAPLPRAPSCLDIEIKQLQVVLLLYMSPSSDAPMYEHAIAASALPARVAVVVSASACRCVFAGKPTGRAPSPRSPSRWRLSSVRRGSAMRPTPERHTEHRSVAGGCAWAWLPSCTWGRGTRWDSSGSYDKTRSTGGYPCSAS